ncbi:MULTISPECIES: IclR family transcriptional regulator [unclassified Microbacterium]|uniref:IclR family transcriptional regulator n=1 Tax=unclassified Microbacterium TaxID=2609290 RepID=UPI003019EE8D
MQESNTLGTAPIRDGNQTLARGLRAFLTIVDSPNGLTVQQVGEMLGVHRSIAYRLLQTLVDFGLVARGRDGVYLPGARLASLAEAYFPTLRGVAAPIMRDLADRLKSTVGLFVAQGDSAVAILMVEPTTATHHIAFKPGMRTSMTVGAAAYAIRAQDPPVTDEPEHVQEAREVGFGRSYSEVESGAYGVAAGIPVDDGTTRACLNLITYNQDVADGAGPHLRTAADAVGAALAAQG